MEICDEDYVKVSLNSPFSSEGGIMDKRWVALV